MSTSLAAISVALLFAGADPAPAAADPVTAFLHAADTNDVAGMRAVLDSRSSGFVRKIEGCYLRRLYANKEAHELIASWMCALGPDRSRVVLANIGLSPANKVVVSIQLDQTNNRPAPERTGSVFED